MIKPTFFLQKTVTYFFCTFSILLLLSCNDAKTNTSENKTTQKEIVSKTTYAQGFSLKEHGTYQILEIKNPWPEAEQVFKYALVKKGAKLPDTVAVDAVITVPVERIIVTSTTHIPSLEMLGVLDRLVAFPNTKFISSEKAAKRVKEGAVKEIGNNESINTETVIELQPDLVVGFGVNGNNKTFESLQRAGINVVYNGDWMEQHPLGKAEWIKFFGALFDQSAEADAIFASIAKDYQQTKTIAQKAKSTPTVVSGALWNDVWYMPKGESWGARFITDANGNYLWSDTTGTGSLALSVESVLEKAVHADYWIGPAQYTSLSTMAESNVVYTQFKAYKNGAVYSFSTKKGEGGGILYYELAPNRPDLVLKDIVKILHPDLLPDYELYFFEKLN